jgi:hypothetical protein
MKTYEIEITQVDVFRVQALDEESAIEHARGHKPDAPGCVLEVVRGHVSARAVHVSAPSPNAHLGTRAQRALDRLFPDNPPEDAGIADPPAWDYVYKCPMPGYVPPGKP